jgi:hypothetical protein
MGEQPISSATNRRGTVQSVSPSSTLRTASTCVSAAIMPQQTSRGLRYDRVDLHQF